LRASHDADDSEGDVLGGAATPITDDPRVVMFKPSLIYIVVDVVMLKPVWMNRYLRRRCCRDHVTAPDHRASRQCSPVCCPVT
jgi:hypothetical protein